MEKIRLVIADSNELIRMGLRSVFKNSNEIEIIGEATDEAHLDDLLSSFGADVVLIDFAARGFSIDVIPRLKREMKHLKFVAITVEPNSATIRSALKAGISSYIKKDCDLAEIMSSVKETGHGGRFFCGQILETLRKEEIDPNNHSLKEFSCEPVHLSERELEIIKLIAEGNTNVQIAEKLFLSNHTVNTHRKNVMAKLGVNNTAAIVLYAVKTKLVSPNKFLFYPTLS